LQVVLEFGDTAGADHARVLQVMADVDCDLGRARGGREKQQKNPICRKDAEAQGINNIIKSNT
jgi:hypothetical protein